MKTLKSKLNLFYFCIVLSLVLIIGVTSALNLFSLREQINGLMINNYNSISAANNMLHSLEEQNANMLSFINASDASKADLFYLNNSEFYKWLNVEKNDITEPGEKELVDKLNINYIQYMALFPKVQQIKSEKGTQASALFYDSTVRPKFAELAKDLKSISNINEKAMFNKKTKLRDNTQRLIYIILIMSGAAAASGFLISRFFIYRFLTPIYSLIETIKSIKEGNLDVEAPILLEDEIGDMTKEFNKMTRRLKEFESSTTGQLMTERNKSVAIVKSISDPLIVLNNDSKLVVINTAFEEFFNIKENEVLDKHFLEVIENKNLYEHISSVIKSGEEKNSSKIVEFTHEGEEFYFNVISTLVKDMYSNTTGIVILFQNVTQLKLVEKMKANFISTISHEFKTPLTSIMIGTSLILDENIGVLNEKQKKIISTIKEDGEWLSELVTNMLQLSKIESDKAMFDIKSCSIVGIIESCAKNFYDRAEENEINLYYDADENLPKINADSEKISWVINNLISNALKYTNAGDEILISAHIEHGEMYISVKDTGIGIPEEYREKIFDKFVQVIGSDSEARGSGLGLTIAKEIVEAHKGVIWCDSEIDVGSTFTFKLPLA